MRPFILFLVLLIGSCSFHNRPERHRHEQMADSIILAMLSKFHGTQLRQMHSKVEWHHGPGPCLESDELDPDPDRSVICYKGKPYAGLMFDCTRLHVAYREKISESAYAHEINHCMEWAINGDADSDHSAPSWRVIPLINRILARYGL